MSCCEEKCNCNNATLEQAEASAAFRDFGPEETIDHPGHYGGDTVYEAIKVIEAHELGFALGNAVKYILRAGKKSTSSEIEDLKKAEWYVRRRIEQLDGKPEPGE